MKALLFGLVSLVIASGSAHAAKKPTQLEVNSAKIEKAVYGMDGMAQSGIEEFKIKPTTDVKAALLDLAFSIQYIEKESEFSWDETGDRWGADGMLWGPADMSDAYSYIMTRSEDEIDYLHSEGAEKELAKYEADLKAAKAAFKGLLNTGVKFGVAPLGAVQCGVTFAALAIIDPAGKIYIFKAEGSGC